MAKGVGLIGNVSGKLGNSVGYTIKNSKTKETQGWRIYQPKVTNPQTYAQMTQRIKMTAVNNFYRAMRSVIQRGFEGKPYGDASRRAWLQMAMSREFQGPYLNKGSKVPVPMLGIPVTVGSLNPVTVEKGVGNDFFKTSLRMTGDPSESVSVLSQVFIDNGYMAGDQVTIVFVTLSGNTFNYLVNSFFIDTADSTTLDWISCMTDGGNLAVCNSNENAIACLITVSRDGENTHLRSTSEMAVADSVVSSWYNVANYDDVMDTYLHTSELSTDWQQVPTRSASGQTADSANALLLDGTTVVVTGWRMVGEQLYFLDGGGTPRYVAKMTDSKQAHFGEWIKSDTVWTDVQPLDSTNATTISLGVSSPSTPTQIAFTQWLLNHGFTYQFLFFDS